MLMGVVMIGLVMLIALLLLLVVVVVVVMGWLRGGDRECEERCTLAEPLLLCWSE